jgi:PAS domain S-box-containing protein
MKIQKRLIVLVGLGMLLIMTITIVSLLDITTSFSRTTRGVEQITSEFQRIRDVEKKINGMSFAVHNYLESGGSDRYRKSYEASRSAARKTLNEIAGLNLDRRERVLIGSLTGDLGQMEKKARRIFSLPSPAGGDKALASDLVTELDGLLVWMGKDIEQYERENTAQMGSVLGELLKNKMIRIDVLFLITLVTSVSFLLAFGFYLHRKVSVPLNDLWGGTEAIIRGDLDFQMQVHGDGDIARLGERFNEMAQRLKQSYAELEQKLFDRTRELAALDAVALTLSKAGTLKDVLDKSLMKILDSLAGIEPKGGAFLCDPGGEILRLIAHKGLPPEFVQREAVIKMGECLCGMVAQSGELLFTEDSCEDPRHTRIPGEDHSHIIIPIKSRGIVLGVIFIYPRKDFKLKPSDVQMLDAIGAQLGMAVENFRFYAEVKESSEKFWDLFENSRDILFTTDAEGKLTAVNKETEKFSGYSKVELSGKSVLDFLTPEEVERAQEMLAGKRTGGLPWTEFEVIKRDGSRAFIEVSARQIMKDGRPAGFQVSARDMTERKSLRELLVKAERLGAIGQVGVAVRHEINNPLTTVIGNIELLIERYEDKDKELTTRLETILNNSLRIGEIVKRLQGIKQEKVVDYLKGVKMTDLK